MPHVLHLVSDPADVTAQEVIRAQAADPETRLSIVLLHDARGLSEALPGEVYHLDTPGEEAPAAGRAIGASDLLDLIFTADSVVTW